MVQTPRRTMREINEQLRMERHREFRTTARRIISAAGLSGLTMQRIADEVGCAIGSVYRYFPSKDALIAELQRDAIDVLGNAFQLSQSHLEELLTERRIVEPRLVSLARVVAGGRFWIGAESTYPQEIELSRLLFTDPAMLMPRDEANRVVPAGMRLLELAGYLLDQAVDGGALRPANNLDRAVVVIAGTNGVLMTSALRRWDDVFDGRRLATMLLRDVLVGWGANPEDLDVADDLVATLAEHDRLVPPVSTSPP